MELSNIPVVIDTGSPAPSKVQRPRAPARSHRLTLVFPPLTMPTSPQLGVAMLKGFIEREMPKWQVTVLDLNIWLFRFLLGGLQRGRNSPHASQAPAHGGRHRCAAQRCGCVQRCG